MKIDTSKWKEYHLYDIFDISMGNKMDRGKMADGAIAFVGRTAKNNGINTRVSKVCNHEKYGTVEPYKKGCLTLALGGSIGSCFYQTEPFYTSQNVAVLIPRDNQDENSLLFVASIISYSVINGEYKAFVEELNKHIKTDFTVRLPSTPSGAPDWDYMENYMKAVMEDCERKYKLLIQISKEKHQVDTSTWKEFRVEDLFDIKLPAARSEKNYEEGEINYVSSGASNNGVTKRLTPKPNEQLDKGHCITVSPLDGSSFWQDKDFMGRGGSGASISMLYNNSLNEFRALFICSVIRNTAKKYGYSDLLNSTNLKTLILKLPTTHSGEPDWQYMENYMKAIVNKQNHVVECLTKLQAN